MGEHVGGGISDETYLERMKRLRASLAEVEETAQVGVPADRAVEWLRALAETWAQADVPEAKADLLHAIYERIVVAGREFVSARLTPTAYAHGLALALPEQVVMARPRGVRRCCARGEANLNRDRLAAHWGTGPAAYARAEVAAGLILSIGQAEGIEGAPALHDRNVVERHVPLGHEVEVDDIDTFATGHGSRQSPERDLSLRPSPLDVVVMDEHYSSHHNDVLLSPVEFRVIQRDID
jgi:hypothetical protein